MQTLDSAHTHYIHIYIHTNIYHILLPAKQPATHQTPVYASLINSIHLPIHIYIPSKHTYIYTCIHIHSIHLYIPSIYPPTTHSSLPPIYLPSQPHLSIHLPSILFIHPPHPFTHPSIHLSIYSLTHPPTCLSICSSIQSPTHLPTFQSIQPSDLSIICPTI